MTASYLTKTPAEILRAYLIAQSIVTDPDNSADWACYVSSLPDADVSDKAVAIFDTTPVVDAQSVSVGDTMQHHGVMVRVRSVTQREGFVKVWQIATALEAMKRTSVVCDSVTFVVQSVVRFSGPVCLGTESDSTKRRYIHTLNILTDIK